MSERPLGLSVNVDHVATLRQARRAAYPDPVAAGAVAEEAGAAGITLHLRVDRRHVQDDDVRRMRERVRGKLNLETSTAPEMLALAREVRPQQVTLVPERPEEVTTEGGLDLVTGADAVRRAAAALGEAGVAVSLFLDPDPRQLDALSALADDVAVAGFEINTDAYTRAATGEGAGGVERRLAAVRAIARDGAGRGFRVYAGHGLTTDNVGPVAALPEVEELNIGHYLVSRAVTVGMAAAVGEMLAAMARARG